MVASGESRPARPVPTRRPAARRAVPLPWLQPGIFLGALVPLISIALRARNGELNADPIAQVENELGLTALIFLIASLACTPARRLWGWTWPTRIRRELGLFAFFYAMLHFLTYLVLDQGYDWQTILDDITKRPFITVGFLALVLLTPLALTSTTASIRRLGFRRWQRLHQLAYLAGVLAVVHFIWRVKIDLSQPFIYAAILGTLLLVRLMVWRSGQGTSAPASPRGGGSAKSS
jgi:methionine sulfoxide reductase heme-binding subunit